MKYVVCLHLYIPWKFGERGSTPRGATGPSLSVFSLFFVCPSRYDARHRKPRRCVYALNLGGMGISPPAKSPPGQKSPGQKCPRAWPPGKVPPGKSPPGQQCPWAKDPRGKSAPGQTSGDIFIAAVAGNWTILVVFCFWCYIDYLLVSIWRR